MTKEKFIKIDANTFKRVSEREIEDTFKVSSLKSEKLDLETKISPLQNRLDEVNRLLGEIKKIK